jgi:ADP-heptose:LPS heptosyltransferase
MIAEREAVVVYGMGGLGDCIHQRAIVRSLARDADVWLHTAWPQLYHDIPEIRLLPHANPRGNRTQAKNMRTAAFAGDSPPPGARALSIGYNPAEVKAGGSLVQAMARLAGGVSPEPFTLPIPQAWRGKVAALNLPDRPLLIYRPLVERIEVGAGAARNPDPDAYKAIFDALRSRFFVVSVADLEPGKEWLSGAPVEADLELHRGELDLEALAALFERASLVFSAPGFAPILAQAVGTPAVTVFGGFETARSFSWGAKSSPWLPIEPLKPCACWNPYHACDKRIDVPAALVAVNEWVSRCAA